jgi:hypothetical protein
MSPEKMRVRADECERLADSLGPTTDDLRKILREIAAKWRRLGNDDHHLTPREVLAGFDRLKTNFCVGFGLYR